MPFKSKPELRKPELRKKIVQQRNNGASWNDISKLLNEEFDTNVSLPTLKKIFDEEVAKTTLKSPKSRDMFKADYVRVKERYDRMCTTMDKLMNVIDKLFDKYGDETPEIFLKFAPMINQSVQTIIRQLEFVTRSQEKIVNQQKNLIYSPIQINQTVDKLIKQYEIDGKIKVLKLLPSEEAKKEEEEEEEKKELEEEVYGR